MILILVTALSVETNGNSVIECIITSLGTIDDDNLTEQMENCGYIIDQLEMTDKIKTLLATKMTNDESYEKFVSKSTETTETFKASGSGDNMLETTENTGLNGASVPLITTESTGTTETPGKSANSIIQH